VKLAKDLTTSAKRS